MTRTMAMTTPTKTRRTMAMTTPTKMMMVKMFKTQGGFCFQPVIYRLLASPLHVPHIHPSPSFYLQKSVTQSLTFKASLGKMDYPNAMEYYRIGAMDII